MTAFFVIGRPAPQGSKRRVGHGQMIESSKYVGPWRDSVVAAALPHVPQEPHDGPLVLHVVFTLARPKSAPKRRQWPDTSPDLSKLVRSTEDALETAGVVANDARFVIEHTAKVWWGYHELALPMPGALIAVEPVQWSHDAFVPLEAVHQRAIELIGRDTR